MGVRCRFLLPVLVVGLLLVAGPLGCSTPEPAPDVPERHRVRVVRSHLHDRGAFTQGLVWHDGWLYESTGGHGRSSLRRVDLDTGRVVQQTDLHPRLFGEGLAIVGDRLVQLTWRSGVGLVYDRESFEQLDSFAFPPEGWGLTYDGERLILSDGSAELRFLDPKTFAETGRIAVTEGGEPVTALNELEYIDGEVWANVWLTDRIVRIDPETGRVVGVVDLRGLLAPAQRRSGEDVLNGIAWDPDGERLFVTGKRWPRLFEIELVPEPPAEADAPNQSGARPGSRSGS